MRIYEGIEYYSENDLADLERVRPQVIIRWYWDGVVLQNPKKFSEYGMMYWTRSQVEEFLKRKIYDYEIDFYGFKGARKHENQDKETEA